MPGLGTCPVRGHGNHSSIPAWRIPRTEDPGGRVTKSWTWRKPLSTHIQSHRLGGQGKAFCQGQILTNRNNNWFNDSVIWGLYLWFKANKIKIYETRHKCWRNTGRLNSSSHVNCYPMDNVLSSFSRTIVSYSVTPWTAAHQASLSFTISQTFAQTHVHGVAE